MIFFFALMAGFTPMQALYLTIMYGSDDAGSTDIAGDSASDAANANPPAAGASSVTLYLAKKYKNMEVTVNGSNLTTDGNGKLNGGSVTDLVFKINGKSSTMQLPGSFPVSDIQDAIAKGSGKVNASNYKDFFDLIIPSWTEQTGAGANDSFEGNGGDDTFNGNAGNDTNFMGKGQDAFNGGKGSDTINAYQIKADVNVNLKTQKASFGTHETTMTGVENAVGGKGKDTLIGNNKKNKLSGGNNNDKIVGNGGVDIIKGGNGNDKMLGGKGNDIIAGNKGNDTYKGNAGKDKFLFQKNEGNNKILDYQDGTDKISLKKFGFKSKKAALKHFYEIGGANDDKVGFDYKGTKIVIKGADLKDIDATDILI